MTVTETMPPDPNMLKFLLERRMPDKYREIKEVQHTHNAGALFQAFLKRMDERAKSEPQLLEAKIIDAQPVSPVLAQDPRNPLIIKGSHLILRQRTRMMRTIPIWRATGGDLPGRECWGPFCHPV